ncbi:MAG: tripartite tricarboxylate transporter substrate binding protein [Hyphomicrobiales bacterium]|nr:tripartite tricarboxylate transporter substrate binding protein [Hyphomicrobiales bacterium]MBV8824526.1 tripartite tricarboxylate transporter substrate binding protein [Hyphomicrobiales bacterium]
MAIDRRQVLTFAAAASCASPAWAQAWPSRTIRIVVPFPAGGSADLSGRLLAEHLKSALGQSVIVESKLGAGGNIAAVEVARAEPDGHTLFIGTNGTQTINQSLYRQIPYDPAKDFAAIAMMWQAPHLLVVASSVPADSLSAFIAYARANPGSLNYGSSGVGSSTHLFGEMFKSRTGIDLTHLPYRGQGPALNDLVGGQIQAMFPIVPDVIAHVRAGNVRALALAAARPSTVLPELPLMPELGYPDLVAAAWVALYSPARTPSQVIERLRAEVTALLNNTAFVDRMKQVGVEIRAMAVDEFEIFTSQERARWAKTIAELKLRID